MDEIQWIKIYTDFNGNKKIKRIRTLPEGNNIVLIWVFIILEAGKCNEMGGLFLTDAIPFTIEDLAIEFNFKIDIIKLALNILLKFSMIEISDDVIYVKNWGKYQNIEGMDKIREQTRIRVQKYRQKKLRNVTCNVTVTQDNATEEEKDIEIEKDIYTEKIYNPIVVYLNYKCKTNYASTSLYIRDLINTKINEGYTLEDFKMVIDNKTNEWENDYKMKKFLRPETLFGDKFERYLKQKSFKTRPKLNKFHNFDQKISLLNEKKLEEIVQNKRECLMKKRQ